MLGWTVAELADAEPLLRIGAPVVTGLSAGVSVALVGYFLMTDTKLRRLYGQLASRTGEGRIDAQELYEILSFGAEGRRFKPVQMMLIGSAAVTTMAAKVMFGDHAVGVVAAFGIIFAAAPPLFAVLTVRRIFQHQYLGARDMVVDEGEGASLLQSH